MEEQMKPGFRMQRWMWETLKHYNDKVLARVMRLIFLYVSYGIVPQAPGKNASRDEKDAYQLFYLFLPAIDESLTVYIRTVGKKLGVKGDLYEVMHDIHFPFGKTPPLQAPGQTPKPKRKTATRKKKAAEAEPFTAPTLEDISAFCAAENLRVNASAFYERYSANGWMVNNKPMQDWKTVLQIWAEANPAPVPTAQENTADLSVDQARQESTLATSEGSEAVVLSPEPAEVTTTAASSNISASKAEAMSAANESDISTADAETVPAVLTASSATSISKDSAILDSDTVLAPSTAESGESIPGSLDHTVAPTANSGNQTGSSDSDTLTDPRVTSASSASSILDSDTLLSATGTGLSFGTAEEPIASRVTDIASEGSDAAIPVDHADSDAVLEVSASTANAVSLSNNETVPTASDASTVLAPSTADPKHIAPDATGSTSDTGIPGSSFGPSAKEADAIQVSGSALPGKALEPVVTGPKEPARRESGKGKDKEPAKGFIHPTVLDITLFLGGRGIVTDERGFFDFYTSNGWTIDGKPMTDWESALMKWASDHVIDPRHTPATYAQSLRHKARQQDVSANRNCTMASPGSAGSADDALGSAPTSSEVSSGMSGGKSAVTFPTVVADPAVPDPDRTATPPVAGSALSGTAAATAQASGTGSEIGRECPTRTALGPGSLRTPLFSAETGTSSAFSRNPGVSKETGSVSPADPADTFGPGIPASPRQALPCQSEEVSLFLKKTNRSSSCPRSWKR